MGIVIISYVTGAFAIIIYPPAVALGLTTYAPTITTTDHHRILAELTPGVWTNISDYVIGNITGYWGFQRDDPTVFIADSGVFNMTLNNTSGIFTPGLTTSLAGWDKGTPIVIVFQKDSTTRRRIYGTITDFDISKEPFSNKRIGVIVSDWFDYAAIHPMISPAIQTLKRGDEMLDTILADMPIQPLNTEFSEGSNIFETAFDTVSFKSKAYSEISKVAVSELGYTYIIKDPVYGETLVFESAWDRSGLIDPPTTTFDNNMTSVEVEYGSSITNRFVVKVNPRYIEAGIKVLYALGSPIRISTGETLYIRGNYTDPSGGADAVGANMIVPVITTDYLMYNAKTGGVNKSADLVITATYGAAGVVYTLTNGSADTCWITKLQARGYLVYKYNAVEQASENTDSQDLYDILEKRIDQKYQKDPYLGHQYCELVLEKESLPRLKLSKVNFIANRSEDLMEAWLTQDIGDLVTIKETQKEIDGIFFIQGIQFSISPTGIVHFSWIVKDMYDTVEHGQLTGIIQDQTPVTPGSSGFNGLKFGYVPIISAETGYNRTVSCWINIAEGGEDGQGIGIITSTIAGGLNGWGFNVYTSTVGPPAKFTLIHINHRWATRGVWYSDEDVILEDTLYNIAYTISAYNNVASNPILYLDGVAITTTEDETPAGAFGSEVGAELMFGNLSGYQYPFSGTIQDVRIFNEVLTPTEIATLHTDGAYGEGVTRGLVFRGPNVRTADLAYYEDHVMVAGDHVLDDIHRVIGTHSSTVTIRLP